MTPAAFILVLLAAALILAEVRGGRGGALTWIRVKFLGEVA